MSEPRGLSLKENLHRGQRKRARGEEEEGEEEEERETDRRREIQEKTKAPFHGFSELQLTLCV